MPKKKNKPGQGRKLKYQDEDELKKLIDQYFNRCKARGKKPAEPLTITGLGLAIGMTRAMLMQYSRREKFADIILEAKQRIEHYAEKRLYEGQAAGPIFALKNFGWSDQQEHRIVDKDGNDKDWTITIVRADRSELD